MHLPIRLSTSIAFCALAFARSSAAQDVEQPLEGHSHLGLAFNEGPRQAAYLMGGPERIDFPVETESSEAQAFFTQGIGQLHGFWYFEAERSFRQAAALDPECAMAYWGMAMANVENEERAAGFCREAWLRREAASEHERMHIAALAKFYDVDYPVEEEAKRAAKREKEKQKEKGIKSLKEKGSAPAPAPVPAKASTDPAPPKGAVDAAGAEKAREKLRSQAYIVALEEILWEYPDDVETKALLANFLWLARGAGIPTTSKASIEALLQQVFAAQPLHPAHHYRIHLWDAKETAKRVVDSAVLAGHALPSIAHQWHMGGHIFDKLGRHADAAWQQEASARTDHAHLMRDRVLPDQIHNFAHNNEWLTRSWRNVGRMHDAIDLAMNMIELPRHPEWNTLEEPGCSAAYGRRRLLEVLELFEQWETLVALADTMYLEPCEDPGEEGYRVLMLGEAHAFLGDPTRAKARVEELEGLLKKAQLARAEALDLAEEQALAARKKPQEVEADMHAALDEHGSDLKRLRDGIAALEGLLVVLATEPIAAPVVEPEEPDEGAAAAETEVAIGPQPAVVPEPDQSRAAEPVAAEEPEELEDGVAKLSEEGERPVQRKRGEPEYPADVEQALKDLRKGRLPKEHVARIHLRLGLRTEAEALARDAAKDAVGKAVPQANLAFVLEELGKHEEALKVFEKVREISARFDMETPPFTRLAELAQAAGHAADWRVPFALPDDVGERPDLDDLGPARWSPLSAPAWTCLDAAGEERALADYRGRPVIVILFLGFGCLHCVEQLEAFAPVAGDFAEAGIEIVSIGTDAQEDIAESLKTFAAGEAPPFPVLADPEMKVFHAYRAYDDFEHLPLHGTFLVDAKGRVRWQDIGFEPFVDHEFLLAEAQRLLGLPDGPLAVSASAPAAAAAGGGALAL